MALRRWTHDFMTAKPRVTDADPAVGLGAVRPHDADSAKKPGWTWVPIRSLAARHRPRIEAHLVSLSPDDRYLRFGHAANDEQISRYVDTLDFDRDEVFGIFNRRLALIAMAHLAHGPMSQTSGASRMAEFGVSVLAFARGRGYGSRLFDHAILHARNRGVDALFIHALSENTAMLKIARQAGARVEREGSESQAWLALPEDNLSTRIGEVVEEQAAQWDYLFKRNAQRRDDTGQPPSGGSGTVRRAPIAE